MSAALQVPGLPGTGLHRESFMRGKPRIYEVIAPRGGVLPPGVAFSLAPAS